MIAYTTEDLFRQMFRGWDSVRTYRDMSTNRYRVQLELNVENLERFRDPAQAIDMMWPKKVTLRRSGVRFHGRRVGKR